MIESNHETYAENLEEVKTEKSRLRKSIS
jgi:hypothetical protein